MAIIKAGTYRFNDVLETGGFSISQDLNAETVINLIDSDNQTIVTVTEITGIGIDSDGSVSYSFDNSNVYPDYAFVYDGPFDGQPAHWKTEVLSIAVLDDMLSSGEIDQATYENMVEWLDGRTVYGEGIKTIIIPTDSEVSAEFYEWFTENAVEQKEEPELPIVTPTKKTTYPILYSATETNFDHNGFGILSACVSCEVTEEANGIFELAMQYPMDGIHYEYIADRAIIKAKADQFREPQLFRVYAISKPMNGIVTVLAEHISYDLSGIPVKPFSADSVALALSGLKSNSVVPCPFDFWTDKGTSANFKVETPSSIRSRLGGVSGSILDVYGGEYEFDNYTVKLHNNRGMNRGVSIRYGKNLTDIQQDQNCSNVATGVYPYWYLETDVGNVLIELPEKIVPAPGTYNFVKIRTLDLSAEFDVQPTHEQLRAKTQEYIKANNIGVPIVSLTVSFAQLEQTEEYKHLKLLERVALFDTVNVEFPALGVSATAKAVKLVYDVLADRVKSVTLGSVRANIADTIANQQQEINQKPSKTFMEVAVENLTKTILGAKGGSVRFLDENGDGEPDTLYIADNPDPTQAVKVWRFNYEGWGASENGYNGPFKLGATIKNGIVADFITSGQIDASLVKVINIDAENIVSGALSSKDGKTFFDLTSSKIVSGVSSGRKVEISKGAIEIATTDGETVLALADGSIFFYDYDGNLSGGISGLFDQKLSIYCQDSDLGKMANYDVSWKTIGDNKVLVGT